ncbi:MAG TPA: hypothetical protein VG106_08870 [Vicinamibacterales bacterium]|nr:hypothetical protein [Vicinamibacterales bacterium]
MDLRTSIAVSMLPVSRAPAAAAFKDLSTTAGAVPPEDVLRRVMCALRVPEEAWAPAVQDALAGADQALTAGVRLGIDPIPLGDARYPVLLACIPDPPPVLWVRGHPEHRGGSGMQANSTG